MMKTLKWGDEELSGFAQRLHTAGSRAIIELISRSRRDHRFSGRLPFDQLFNCPIEGTTEDGWRFRASAAGTASCDWNYGPDDSERRVTVAARNWTLTSGIRTGWWASELHWEPPAYIGNLALAVVNGGWSGSHYYLRGSKYDYALVKSGRSNWSLVVIERNPEGGGSLEHHLLLREFRALSLAFGTPFALSTLHEVDHDLRVLGVVGGSFDARSGKAMHEQGPVPSTNDLRALPVAFFESMAQHMSSRSAEELANLTSATWYYLEALSEPTADGALVKMALAATAASRYLLGERLKLVTSEQEYQGWVAAQGEEISRLGVEGNTDHLARQIAESLVPLPATAIRMALSARHLTLTAELSHSLELAAACLRGGDVPPEDFHEGFARLRMVASALVASCIGYSGVLASSQRAGEMAFYLPSEWWPGDTSEVAERYEASIPEPEPDIGRHWPDVRVPTIPTGGLLELVRRFAAGLASRTENRVHADLRPLVSTAPDGSRRFEFVLRVTALPSARAVLFLVRLEHDVLHVEGWPDAVTLESPTEVARFAANVGAHDQTRRAIERLLLVAEEVAQDGAR